MHVKQNFHQLHSGIATIEATEASMSPRILYSQDVGVSHGLSIDICLRVRLNVLQIKFMLGLLIVSLFVDSAMQCRLWIC